MLKIDLLAASEWAAEMSARLMTNGYAPIITIGAVLGKNGELGFAVAGAPGTDDVMIQTVMQTLLELSAAGKAVWRTETDLDEKDRLFSREDLSF